tara:strand:- start:818 stop:964 length:147 start_codon:yes stop_codon:yes gene_type:complete
MRTLENMLIWMADVFCRLTAITPGQLDAIRGKQRPSQRMQDRPDVLDA